VTPYPAAGVGAGARGTPALTTSWTGTGADMIAGVVQTPLSLDTSPDIERRQVESWRRMSPAQKAALVTGLTRAAWEMTSAGGRQRYPGAPPREHFLWVAVIVLGPDLARRAYPDAAAVISR
jgi:hypothetical protein